MALRQADSGLEAGRIVRLAALVALFLALSLCVWRGSSLLTGAPAAPRSAAEASLSALIDPVAGPGNSRISIAFNAEGGRTLFVLLDTPAAPMAGDLQRILPEAAGLDFKRGDKLIIEQATFARGLPGRPDTAAWLELGALGLIALLSAGIALATLLGRGAAPVTVSPPREADRAAAAELCAEALRPLRPLAPVPAPEAADMARRNPARAAAVLRGWMSDREEAS